MRFFKILTGAAIGVGAIAAAPFTGGGSVLAGATIISSLAGGGAIAAATGAAVSGALVADAVSKQKDKEIDTAWAKGLKAGAAQVSEKYEQKVVAMAERMKEYRSFEEAVVGMFAVGIAVANVDGTIAPEELEELDAFVAGISSSALPSHTKDAIIALKNTPPSFEEAISKAQSYGVNPKDIDFIVELMVNADGYIHIEEEHLMEQWERRKSTYQFIQ